MLIANATEIPLPPVSANIENPTRSVVYPVAPNLVKAIEEVPIQRKWGRPPLSKQVSNSSHRLAGMKSQKRNICLAQGSPKQKNYAG